MNSKMYRRGIRYASVLTKNDNSIDVVHDAYLNWYDKKNSDLFDQPAKTIFKVIKNTFFNNFKKDHKYWTSEGERHKIQSIPMQSIDARSEEDGIIDNRLYNQNTPESELISLDSKKNFGRVVDQATATSNTRINGIKSRLDEVYKFLVEGYPLKEIAVLMGLKRPAISHYSKQLQNL